MATRALQCWHMNCLMLCLLPCLLLQVQLSCDHQGLANVQGGAQFDVLQSSNRQLLITCFQQLQYLQVADAGMSVHDIVPLSHGGA